MRPKYPLEMLYQFAPCRKHWSIIPTLCSGDSYQDLQSKVLRFTTKGPQVISRAFKSTKPISSHNMKLKKKKAHGKIAEVREQVDEQEIKCHSSMCQSVCRFSVSPHGGQTAATVDQAPSLGVESSSLSLLAPRFSPGQRMDL